MRGFFVLVPVFLLAGFSPPSVYDPGALPLQGAQEGPPKSWIPEKTPKPPITVTPEIPNQPATPPPVTPQPGNSGNDRTRSIVVPPSRSDPQYCEARKQGGGKPSEAFVNAYNDAKTAIAAGRYDKGLVGTLEAERFATSFQMKSALLSMQILIAQGLGDSSLLEETIAKRVAMGCLGAGEQQMFEKARQSITSGKGAQ